MFDLRRRIDLSLGGFLRGQLIVSVTVGVLYTMALMALGMMMMPPVMVSLPFKLLLFVLVNGWGLVITALVGSYG